MADTRGAEDWIVAVIERSATFEERLAGELVATEPSTDDEIAAICRAAGLSPAELAVRGPVAAMLGRARLRATALRPRWATALVELLADPPEREVVLDAIEPDDGGAFAASLAVLVRNADRWLDQAIAAAPVAIAPAARRGLLTWLGRTLTNLARFVLYQRMRATSAASPQDFAHRYLTDPRGWRFLLGEHPVLARLVGEAYDRWQRGCRQLFDRLAADWSALGEARAAELSAVAALALKRPFGRCPPLQITLPSGRRLVYQDKDLRIAAWFGEVVEALDREGLVPALSPPAILAREDYAWSDFVAATPCTDREQVARYFQRIGSSLRLFQALRGTDLHVRNIVAAGEHPSFIDLEAILQPARCEPSLAPVERALADRLARSPLGSTLLPVWLLGDPGRRGINIGGLNRGGLLVTPACELVLTDPTTRRADYARAYLATDLTPTVPSLGGRLASMTAHLPQILAGYAAASGVLARSAGVRAAIERARDHHVTVLWRSGFLHKQVIDQSLAPTLLTDGRARDAFLTRMMLGFADASSRTLARSELLALREGAAPVFASCPASTAAGLPEGGELAGAFEVPALDCLELVRSPADAARDLDLIASAIGLEAEASGSAPPTFARAIIPLTATTPLDHAVAIADTILDDAITAGGESMWIGAAWCPTAAVRQLAGLPLDLLSGNAGLATMFAYLYRRTEAPRFRDAATRALAPVLRALRQPAPFGAFIGLGAQLYAVRKCGELLADAAAVARVDGTLATLEPATVVARGNRDVLTGAAGIVLVAANASSARPANLEPVVAWLRERRPSPRLYPEGGGARGGLPDEDEGVTWALSRWGVPVRYDNLSLLTRVTCGSPAASHTVGTTPPRATLDSLLLALAARDASRDDAFTPRARQIAGALAASRASSGRWLDDPYATDRVHLSAVTGLGALALALARVDAPALRCCTRLVY